METIVITNVSSFVVIPTTTTTTTNDNNHHKHTHNNKYFPTKPKTQLYESSMFPQPNVPKLLPLSKQKKKNLKTFQRYLEIECWKRDELRNLQPVLQAVGDACKQINRIVQRAQTDDLYGVALGEDGLPLDDTNIQGEVQQQLDVLCNTIMLRCFCGCSNAISSVASEEEDEPRSCADVMGDNAFAVGDYVAVFDPIDGSKNIDSSLPVGTVFGIFRRIPGIPFDEEYPEAAFLQTGENALVAAGYCLYSATTVLVVTLGSGVNGFTLDPDKGVFLQTHPDIRIPRAGPIYSFNEANFHSFQPSVQKYLDALKDGSSSVGIRSNARYVGALVADVHNVLINGGIYGYPSTDTNQDGKLRLLYESAPMAMIMEQAGGAGSTGKGRILDVMPTQIHQRVPTFLGSIENVFELDEYHKRYSGTVNSKSVGGDGNNESYLKPTTTSANGDGDIDEITDDETI